jgi:hypothetical protein
MLLEKNSSEIKKVTSLSHFNIGPLAGKGDFSDGDISYSISLEI